MIQFDEHVVHSWVGSTTTCFPLFLVFLPWSGPVTMRMRSDQELCFRWDRRFFFVGFPAHMVFEDFQVIHEFNFRMGTHSCAWMIFLAVAALFNRAVRKRGIIHLQPLLSKSHVPKKSHQTTHQPPWQKLTVYSVYVGDCNKRP